MLSDRGEPLDRLEAYVEELQSAREDQAIRAIRGRVQMILNVLVELREHHQAVPFGGLVIESIQALKHRAKLHEVIPLLHAERLRELGLPNRGVRPSSRPRRHHIRCYACHKALDSGVDIECVICNWVLCFCGACGCGFNRRRA